MECTRGADLVDWRLFFEEGIKGLEVPIRSRPNKRKEADRRN